MRRPSLILAAATLSACIVLLAAPQSAGTWFSPGKRTTMLAHNAFPAEDKWTDRLDRSLSAGTPSAIELDLIWRKDPKTGAFRSFVAFSNDPKGGEPTLSQYLFEKVRPAMEKALRSGNRADWPLNVLFLDIKDHQQEHIEAIWREVKQYESWLTTAAKTNDLAKQSALNPGPLMVVVNDKPGAAQQEVYQEVFYNRIPVGGKLLVFGAAPTFTPTRPAAGAPAQDLSEVAPEKYFLEHANNFRRWLARPWNLIEKGGVQKAGDWTPAEEARLRAITTQAHKLGYLIAFYHLNGHSAEDNKGWEDESNFGSLERSKVRWTACVKAGVDFISTDQYEEVAELIRKTSH